VTTGTIPVTGTGGVLTRWASAGLSPHLLGGTRLDAAGSCAWPFRDRFGVRLFLGNPLGPVEAWAEALEAALAATPRQPVFVNLDPEAAWLARQRGLTLARIGEEALLDLRGFSLAGNRRKSVRQSAARARRDGLEVRVLEPSHDATTLAALDRVSCAWLGRRRLPEIRFGIGWFDHGWVRRTPVTAVFDGTGRCVAFCTRVQYPARGEAGFDLLRHDGNAPGAVDLLVTSQLSAWQEDGYRTASLGLAPLTGPGLPRTALRRLLSPWYDADGLHRFKNRYRPEWQPRYVAF
jgi:phosphatidylglycerol lysyltransferase